MRSLRCRAGTATGAVGPTARLPAREPRQSPPPSLARSSSPAGKAKRRDQFRRRPVTEIWSNGSMLAGFFLNNLLPAWRGNFESSSQERSQELSSRQTSAQGARRPPMHASSSTRTAGRPRINSPNYKTLGDKKVRARPRRAARGPRRHAQAGRGGGPGARGRAAGRGTHGVERGRSSRGADTGGMRFSSFKIATIKFTTENLHDSALLL